LRRPFLSFYIRGPEPLPISTLDFDHAPELMRRLMRWPGRSSSKSKSPVQVCTGHLRCSGKHPYGFNMSKPSAADGPHRSRLG
jgi:hypothetical protein